MFHYLEDILLLGKHPAQLLEHRKILLTTLVEYGWIINHQKSHLSPTQQGTVSSPESIINRSENKEGEDTFPLNSFRLPQPAGSHVLVYSNGPLDALALEALPAGVPKTMEPTLALPFHMYDNSNAQVFEIVDGEGDASEIVSFGSCLSDHNYNRHQRKRMGSSLQPSGGPGKVGIHNSRYRMEYTGN